MRHEAYLSTSRHGIFYFRWPIPATFHPEKKRTDVKVSLRTRRPKTARHLSRLLSVAGHSVISRSSVRTMRYEEIRQHVQAHFQEALRRFQENVAADGPFTGSKLDGLRTSQELAGADPEVWAELLNVEGPDGLLRRFRDVRGIRSELSASEEKLLLEEFQKGYRAFVSTAQDHNANFNAYDLGIVDRTPTLVPLASVPSSETINEVIDGYLSEGERFVCLGSED